MINLWDQLNEISEKFQSNLDIKYRRNNGIYYTGFELAYQIIEDLFDNVSFKKPIYEYTFFEPCGGTGNFVFAYLKYIYTNYHINKDQAYIMIRNIYFCEPDLDAKKIYINNMINIAQTYFNVCINKEDLNIGDALIYNLQKDSVEYIPLSNYFSKEKFDIIVTNPPYKSLRAERRNYVSDESFEIDKNKYKEIKNQAKKRYILSNSSSSNIFKYFVEEILLKYSHNNSIITILIPSSILTDKSCENLRKDIINNNGLKVVKNISENNKYIQAQQALTYLVIDKSTTTDTVKITDIKNEITYVNIKDFIDENHGYTILVLKNEEYSLLNKMMKLKKIKDFKSIINMRGELDLTLNKKSILKNKTPYKLVKGRNINRYKFSECNNGYIDTDFVKVCSKRKYIEKERIACQQIVNINKVNRLMFAVVPPNYVLGNSCNFIYIEKNLEYINLYYLLGLLNSDILNWYFKLFSSNNHVNNYELDNLPVPTGNKELIIKISQLAYQNTIKYSQLNDNKINELVNQLFDLEININSDKKENNINDKEYLSDCDLIDINKNNILFEKISKYSINNPHNRMENAKFMFKNDIDIKADNFIKKKNDLLKKEFILNNTSYKMSDLDMEIICSIPQGGNWNNIPQETMNKSKRLLGIQKTGGRTTLYGRLHYDKPSYTITTYFNRPGNGCYIHPVKDRVLTTREAARFQCFPDNYYFYGNQKDILNQIGNAVPTLIGYLIGKKIKDILGCNISLDLFSGAGGLLYGIKQAGIKHVLANDINREACITLKINNPELEVIHGDITNEAVKNEIIRKGLAGKASIICGGPPCQGFSLAGYRRNDDPRNKLFRDFYDVVNNIKPKVFVFENVIGILSYNKGKTYEEIKNIFKEIGYNVHGETLMFNEYAVPQKRKRVIIIGIRSDLNIDPRLLYPDKITIGDKNQITVRETIGDLENIELNSEVKTQKSNSNFQKYIKGEITIEMYLHKL